MDNPCQVTKIVNAYLNILVIDFWVISRIFVDSNSVNVLDNLAVSISTADDLKINHFGRKDIIQQFEIVSRQIDGIAPTFAKKPAIRQEDDGKRLIFECRIEADPTPAVQWWHNAAMVNPSDRHKVTNILHGLIHHSSSFQ